MQLEVTDKERDVLLAVLRNAVDQLDEMMVKTPSRDAADASNALEDVLVKLKEKEFLDERRTKGSQI